MNKKPTLLELTALATIVARRSFRKAADELGLAPSSLSHTIRTLEAGLGVRLLNRTTRSVSPTAAGEQLVARLHPALRELDLALAEVDDFRRRPSGTLRINASETAARLLLQTVVPTYLQRHPDVALDLVTEGELVDIVAHGFDAGVRLGESLPQDMIAVSFGGPVRFVAVASPAYLAARPPPKVPDDLRHHDCIRVRMPSGKLYRWEFARRGQELALEVSSKLTLDHLGLMVEAAVDGLGVAYVPDRAARAWLDDGRLVEVLPDWCPEIAGLALYYPGNRLVPAALQAFIELLRERWEPTPPADPQGDADGGIAAPRVSSIDGLRKTTRKTARKTARKAVPAPRREKSP